MKTLHLQGPKDLAIRDLPKPTIQNETDALIKIQAAGICGSDLGAYKGTNPTVIYPLVLGHELAGEIVEMPKGATSFRPGDRVVVEPYINCRKCYPCGLGRGNNCTDLKVTGVHCPGGMSEYFTHPVRLLHKIPAKLSYVDAAVVEPLTIAIHAVKRGRVAKGERVLIFGAGPIGLLAGLMAVRAGGKPIMVDPDAGRLKLAAGFGLGDALNPRDGGLEERVKDLTKGRMAEVVIEASGADAAVKDSVFVAANSGRIVFLGWPKDNVLFNTIKIIRKEIEILGSRNSCGDFPDAIEILTDKKVDLGKFVTHVEPLEKAPALFSQIAEHPDKFLKVVLTL